MNARIIGVAGALLLLAACSSPPPPPLPAGGPPGGPPPGAEGAVVPGSQQDLAQTAGDRVFFAFDSSNISPEARQILERQAQWLEHYPNVDVRVEGHCDKRGTEEYNLALGERRAHAVKEVLVAFGVSPTRITTISYGKDRPIVLGDSEEDYAQNRVAITRVR